MTDLSLTAKWTECLGTGCDYVLPDSRRQILIGTVTGEGVGPEVIDAAMVVTRAIADESGIELKVRSCDLVRQPRRGAAGKFSDLPPEISEFCRDIFEEGGAVLCGPGGGRFVYELRRELRLFLKISPLRAVTGHLASSPVKPEILEGLDILVVRENCGGVYQGDWNEIAENSDRLATHRFDYRESEVRDFLRAAARLAKSRSGHLTVVWKESGVPSISGLWERCISEISREIGITYQMVDADLMSYRLIREPSVFDIVAAPNLFGDILADLAAVLVGSRGATFSGNFDRSGNGIYQTNHGAAFDLAGKQVANPTGQIFSAAMMLRESFGLAEEAAAIEAAVRCAWSEGHLTADMAPGGEHPIGTGELGKLIAENAVGILREHRTNSEKSASHDASTACAG